MKHLHERIKPVQIVSSDTSTLHVQFYFGDNWCLVEISNIVNV